MRCNCILKTKLFFLLGALPVFLNSSYADDVNDIISKSEASSAKAAPESSKLIEILRNNAKNESPSSAKENAVKDIPLAHEGRERCKDKPGVAPGVGKCPSTLLQSLESKQVSSPSSDTQLLVFVSQSMPEDSLKQLWNQAQKVGGKLVFRGLVGGSFKETQSYIGELEIVADIDPTKFEEFEVVHVPTFVLFKRTKEITHQDKMVGNVSVEEFLSQTSERGDLKAEARMLLKRLQGESS